MSSSAKLVAKSPSESESVVTELMMPRDANVLGPVFGGKILSMVDRAAAVAAMRHGGCKAVTVSVDRIDFNEPIYVGELVMCKARVNYVGRTSMEIGVRVEAENILTGVRRHTNTCYLTFVAIDDNGKPTHVRPLNLESAEDRKRWYEAERRRENRRELAAELGEAS